MLTVPALRDDAVIVNGLAVLSGWPPQCSAVSELLESLRRCDWETDPLVEVYTDGSGGFSILNEVGQRFDLFSIGNLFDDKDFIQDICKYLSRTEDNYTVCANCGTRLNQELVRRHLSVSCTGCNSFNFWDSELQTYIPRFGMLLQPDLSPIPTQLIECA